MGTDVSDKYTEDQSSMLLWSVGVDLPDYAVS